MKNLKYLLFVIPFLFIGSVKADEVINFKYEEQPTIRCSFRYFSYDYLLESGFGDEIEELYSLVIKNYNDNYSSNYKYYSISLVAQDSKNCNTSRGGISKIYMSLLAFNEEIPLFYFNEYNYVITGVNISKLFDNVSFTYHFDVSENLYITPSEPVVYLHPNLFILDDNQKLYNPLYYFISNYNFVNTPVTLKNNDGVTTEFNRIYNVTGYDEDFSVGIGDTIYPMFSADSPFSSSYKEVNLNDYAYVALSLKDYNVDQFDINFQMKGQFCSTPVYNYGMTTKDSVVGNKITDRCSPYYDNFTPVRFSVLDKDLKNNSIYYLKAYDKSKDNIVKVDTSIFNIHYITEEEANNPILTINGKKYSAIPYSDLPSTSTKNEEENYVPGSSEKFSFSDIFTTPLEFLKDIWNSIANVFTIINQFILLLPETLQYFFYISFTLAIVLGIIKIIL